MPSGRLTSGAKPAKGGYRPGAGRKPDAFKALCAELASSPEFIAYARKVLAGERVVPHVTKEGIAYTEATPSERTYLWEKLAGYGYGKPAQEIQHSGEVQGRFILVCPEES